MTAHHPTKAAQAKTDKAAKAKADKAAAAAAAAKLQELAEAKANEGLFTKLDEMADKTPAMQEVHKLIAQMHTLFDQAIDEAEGDVKDMLEALRAFLF